MMANFPSYWRLGDHGAPVQYHTAESVPAGWTRVPGNYDSQTGQWVEESASRNGPVESVDVNDLPAIAGFVRDGFDMDAPEAGYPKRVQATVEPQDAIVPEDTEANRKPVKKRNAGRTKALKSAGKTRKGSTQMSDQKKPTNDPNAPIDTPQPNEAPSKPQDDSNTAKERGSDGTVRTGNRPTVR